MEPCPKCAGKQYWFETWVDDYHPDGDWYEYEKATCAGCGYVLSERSTHCSEFASDEHYEGVRREFVDESKST